MKPTFFLFLLVLPFFSYSQAEKPEAKSAAAQFEKNYNAGDFPAIFALFSPETQIAIPLDKTIQFLGGLSAQAGKITSRTFSRYEKGFAVYKTQFERMLFALNLSVGTDGKINGFSVRPFTDITLPQMARNITPLKLPFRGEWTVVWGGDTKEQNYHVESVAQKNAFDIVIKDANGRSYKTDGKTNEDYFAFGKELTAPCDGEVVLVVDGIKDNTPGELNPVYVPGNTVIIHTANNEYLFFAHFKQHSIKVAQGDKVKAGQLLGLCGNSGNSSEAHVHFHIQNVENMNVATGVKCFFESLTVNGQATTNYSPVKNDRVKSN